MSDDPFTSPKVTDAAVTSSEWKWSCLFSGLLGFLIVGGVIALLVMPLLNRARSTVTRNGLKMIGLALHNYHDVYDSFPPAYTVDEAGQPLHSWRTLLLPYLEQQSLYETIDLSKPWDDPVNARAFETEVPIYRNLASGNHTNYLGVSGPDSVLSGSESVSIKQITDGTSNTLLVVQVPADRTVPWMTPVDVDDVAVWGTDPASDVSGFGGFHALLADAGVRHISPSIDQTTLQSLLTIAGGETVGEF